MNHFPDGVFNDCRIMKIGLGTMMNRRRPRPRERGTGRGRARVAPVAVNEDVAIPPELAAALGNDPFERAFRTPNARGGDDDETATPTRRNSRRQQRRASQQRAAGGGSPSASRSPTGRDRRPTS